MHSHTPRYPFSVTSFVLNGAAVDGIILAEHAGCYLCVNLKVLSIQNTVSSELCVFTVLTFIPSANQENVE